MESKKCAHCQKTYYSDTVDGLTDFFNWRNKKKLLLASHCKECRREINQKRYQDNKEHFLELNKEYYKNNKEKFKEYYQNDKEKRKQSSHSWNIENKERRIDYNKKYYIKTKQA